MKSLNILFCIICFLLLDSCSIPDPDKNPLAFYFYIRIAKGIERRVFYDTEYKIFEIPDYISFENEVKSQNPEISPVSLKKYYVNYYKPFELCIDIKLLNRNIKEIIFQKCSLIKNGNEINLFDTANENIALFEYKKFININGGSSRLYKGNFFDGYKFIVNNDTKEYFSGFSLSFNALPFDYINDSEIEITYDVIIIDENNNFIEKIINALFIRSFAEKKIENENIFWDQISFDEWKEHIK